METEIFGFLNRTLIVDFCEPMRVVSTLEGDRTGIRSVGNHYFPPPSWDVPHKIGFEKWKRGTLRVVGKSRISSSFLFTGADMANLSVQRAHFGDMKVCALVTAGVESNAIRTSVDEGLFYEKGTINIILLTGRRLTRRAMTRAILTATEAKTAALQDLDIRSAYHPRYHQATGTGTDEVLVVEGRGKFADNAGGHCKMGELIARVVYDGVREAVLRQNGIANPRSVLQRLKERRIDLRELVGERTSICETGCGEGFFDRMEAVLSQSRYASFLEAALALSDAYESGRIGSLEGFEEWCRGVAREIAGQKSAPWIDWLASEDIPIVLKLALNALLNGFSQGNAVQEESGRPLPVSIDKRAE